MLTSESRMWLVIGTWLGVAAGVVVWSIALGARPSTSALLFAGVLAPAGVALLIGLAAPSSSMAELLHAVDVEERVR